jgi:hypothetical protein
VRCIFKQKFIWALKQKKGIHECLHISHEFGDQGTVCLAALHQRAFKLFAIDRERAPLFWRDSPSCARGAPEWIPRSARRGGGRECQRCEREWKGVENRGE